MASSSVQYPLPSTINVANFVSTKLWFNNSVTNYKAWKGQMLCLIEGQELLGFIDGSIPPHPETASADSSDGKTAIMNQDYFLWRRTDRLLKGWILGSLHENMVSEVAALKTARDVWLHLENKFCELPNQLQLQLQTASVPAPTSTEQNQQEKDLMEYMPVHKAALQGDWETAKRIFDGDPGATAATLNYLKEVEKFVHPHSRERLNYAGKSPKMVFTEEHKTLKEGGEKWMKDTSNSCTIAAALIATVMFAAAITVPGGNDSSHGVPIFSGITAFIVFAISDAVSLFTSATSLLMFLAILTSRYAEEDFLYVLPKRLIIGLGTLFLSITFMMMAFSATLYLVFGQKQAWVLIPVGALACLPVTSFVLLQFPLLVDLISSTYGPGIFGKQSSRPFY